MALDLNDKTSNGNNLTNVGGCTDITTSLPFAESSHAVGIASASGQSLSKSDSASLSLTGNFTLESWVKWDSLPADGFIMVIMGKANFSTNNRGYMFGVLTDVTTTKFQIIINQTADDTTRDVVRWTYALSTGTWYHCAVVCTIANATATKFELFINGSSQGNGTAIVSGNCASINDNAEPFVIGDSYDLGGIWAFNGKQDDTRVWNTTRTGTQIANNYQVELTGSESGLQAYWPYEPLTTASGRIPGFMGLMGVGN